MHLPVGCFGCCTLNAFMPHKKIECFGDCCGHISEDLAWWWPKKQWLRAEGQAGRFRSVSARGSILLNKWWCASLATQSSNFGAELPLLLSKCPPTSYPLFLPREATVRSVLQWSCIGIYYLIGSSSALLLIHLFEATLWMVGPWRNETGWEQKAAAQEGIALSVPPQFADKVHSMCCCS